MDKRAGIYVRISSDPQGLRAGVERQEADCRALAESRGWTVAEVFADNDISAYSGKPRPEYKRMLADIESGEINAVITWHLDRLHRSPKELESFFEVCDTARLKDMATVTGSIDLSTDDGRFHARIMGAVARKSSDDSSRRLKRKFESLAQNGQYKGGKRPFGFERDGTTLRTEEAALVREAARRILAGDSLRGICADWNQSQVADRTWVPQALKRILISPRMAGLREHKGVVIGEAQWEAIIDRGAWERMGGLLTDHSRSRQQRARSYLLTGHSYCGFCDSRMGARPRTNGTRAYVCHPDTGGCNKVSIKAEPLEELVRDEILAALDSQALAEVLRAASGEDEAQKELLESLQADQTAIDQLAKDHYADRLIGRSEYLAARGALEGRMGATRKALERNTGAGVLASISTGIQDAWESRGFDWRRALIGAVLERVVIHPAKRGYPKFDPDRVQLVWRA